MHAWMLDSWTAGQGHAHSRGEPAWASSAVTARDSPRSALLPARAMIMLGLPCLCSSFTHVLAFARLSVLVMSNTMTAAAAPLHRSADDCWTTQQRHVGSITGDRALCQGVHGQGESATLLSAQPLTCST